MPKASQKSHASHAEREQKAMTLAFNGSSSDDSIYPCSASSSGSSSAGKKSPGYFLSTTGYYDRPQKTRKIFVGGIPTNITSKDIVDVASQFGSVEDVNVLYDKETKRHRGFCFITYTDFEAAHRAAAQHYVSLGGRTVEFKKAVPKEDMFPSPDRQFIENSQNHITPRSTPSPQQEPFASVFPQPPPLRMAGQTQPVPTTMSAMPPSPPATVPMQVPFFPGQMPASIGFPTISPSTASTGMAVQPHVPMPMMFMHPPPPMPSHAASMPASARFPTGMAIQTQMQVLPSPPMVSMSPQMSLFPVTMAAAVGFPTGVSATAMTGQLQTPVPMKGIPQHLPWYSAKLPSNVMFGKDQLILEGDGITFYNTALQTANNTQNQPQPQLQETAETGTTAEVVSKALSEKSHQ